MARCEGDMEGQWQGGLTAHPGRGVWQVEPEGLEDGVLLGQEVQG